ncbi:MAG: DoxX family protein [Pirellulales bacterium]|nr:DoxX family protein [Pirellulales bacterium]
MNATQSNGTHGIASALRSTSSSVSLFILRMLVGLPLLFFGILHFMKLATFSHILIASGIPMVEFNKFAAPAIECLAGILLIPGWYTRLGGVLAIFTMGPAIFGTVAIQKLTSENLPPGLDTIPQVPPLSIPIALLIVGVLLTFFGGGRFSLDRKNTVRHPC